MCDCVQQGVAAWAKLLASLRKPGRYTATADERTGSVRDLRVEASIHEHLCSP